MVLRQMEDMSIRDTAAALGISEGAVKRYTADGTKRLDTLLGTATDHHETADIRLTGGAL